MTIIGITGGTGAGKSIVNDVFANHGYPTYDCDAAYHALVSYRSPCVEELVSVFGDTILAKDGGLDRAVLRELVFSSGADAAARLAQLNQISHRYVKEDLFAWCGKMESLGHDAVVIDAPTLFEAELEGACAVVIGVIAPYDVRVSRVAARDHISYDSACKRINAQHDDDFYRTHCDYIVENSSTTDDVIAQTNNIINELLKRGILK